MDKECIIGMNPVIEAMKSGRKVHSLLISEQLKQQSINTLQKEAKKKRIEVKRVPRHVLDKRVKGKHQGVVAYVEPYAYASLEDLFTAAASRNEQPFFVVLDELEDPHNLGSILRTADATGVHGIIIPKHRAVGLTSTVAKTSVGAIEYVPVVQVTNIVQTLKELKDRNVWVVGTAADAADDYRTLDGETAIALVIGNEGSGISRLVQETCDWNVQLPMKGRVSSLNASVAGSLLMYEIYRKRFPLGE